MHIFRGRGKIKMEAGKAQGDPESVEGNGSGGTEVCVREGC